MAEAMIIQVVGVNMTQAVDTQVEEDMIQVVEDTVEEDIVEVEDVIQVVAEEVVVIQVAEEAVTKVNCLS